MGWYHHELASGKDPFQDEREKAAKASCPDGTCASTALSSTKGTSSIPTATPTATVPKVAASVVPDELYMEDGPIYHLCDKSNWMTSIRIGRAYFPPTFWLDGRFTRSCCQLDTICDTGNEYYRHSSGQWICLELNPTILRQMGIPIAIHRNAPESTPDHPVQCLKIYGGISVSEPNLITKIYAMERQSDDGTFIGMKVDDVTPKKITVTQKPPQQGEQVAVKEELISTTTTTTNVEPSETAPEKNNPTIISKKDTRSPLRWFQKKS